MSNGYRNAAEQLLGGLGNGSLRRVPTILKLIYVRVAECAKAHRGNSVVPYESGTLTDTRNKSFLDAISRGAVSDGADECTIQEIERYALEWADIVPQNSAIKADIFRRLGESYVFRKKDVTNIINVLSLDDPSVADAFLEQNGLGLDTVYAPATSVRERGRWIASNFASWFENLPTFWASFALTISSTLGPVVLALPIVLLSFGPLVALIVIFLAGALNTLTLAHLAESQQRAGLILRGHGFNHMIVHYLGKTASRFLKFSLFAYCLFVLFAFTGGFLSAIGDTIGGPTLAWFAGLILFVMWYLSPKNQGQSLTTAFAIAVINPCIMAGLCTVIMLHVLQTDATAAAGGFLDGQKEVPLLLAIGAILYAFAGHISVSNGANLILKRRDAGPGFIKGSVAGMATMTMVYSVWACIVIFAMTKGVLPTDLPLLEGISIRFGPVAMIASTIFVVLTLGIGSGNYAMAAYHVLHDTIAGLMAGTKADIAAHRPNAKIPSVVSLLTVSLVMVAAAAAYLRGQVDLASFFGLIGGLMAPIVAGVFPILLYVACKSRGVEASGAVRGWMSSKTAALFAFVAFLAVIVCQSLSVESYQLWYRAASAIVAILVTGIAVSLLSNGRLSSGYVVEITKTKDGWDPAAWRFFEDGHAIAPPELTWKTTKNGSFEPITPDTNPVRVLSAVKLTRAWKFGANVDVVCYDRISKSPIRCVATDATSGNAGTLEISFNA